MERVLLTDGDRFPFAPAELSELTSAGGRLDLLAGHDPADIARMGATAAAVLVYSGRFDENLIARLPRCRVLARCGVGYDNIDVVAAAARGITVTYVPAYGAEDVAEHAIALLFACARRLAQSDREVQAGSWPSYRELGTMRRISGRTLGLLGFGRIAREVASRAAALRLRVIAHDPFVAPQAGSATQTQLVAADQLFAESDFLSVHLPLTPATRHLVGARELALMRPGAILINTSRGAVIDEPALVAALDAGLIGGLGLDVLEREPASLRDGLLGRPDVIITPHTAAYTEEALGEVRRTALADIVRVLRGQEPVHVVPELATAARAGNRRQP
jgi:D-3-phosphoglycerate dehydrogenase